MSSTDVYEFTNSDACRGVGIANDSGSHDIITIKGSYPADGSWACNRVVEEQVIVVSGIGNVALRGVEIIQLDASSQDHRAVTVEAGTWFRWNGDMTISMVCRPKFEQDQYEVKTDEQIEAGDTQ